MKLIRSALAIFTVLSPLILTLPGAATTYEWKDDSGTLHFSDNRQNIPAKYLDRVRELETGSSEINPPSSSPASQRAEPSPDKLQERNAAHSDTLDEKLWRSSIASLQTEIMILKDDLTIKKEYLNGLRRKRAVHQLRRDRIEYNNLEQEIGRDEARMKLLQEKLKLLDAEAVNAGVTPDWRQ